MDRRVPRLLLMAGCVALLALLILGGVADLAMAEDEPVTETPPVWRNEAWLQSRFAEACEAVEKVVGMPFETRPTLRLSTRDEVATILRRELAPQLEATGQTGLLERTAVLSSRLILAKYDTARRVVHLLPDRFEDEAMPLFGDLSKIDEDFLRIVLAHEVAHAHDFPRFGWTERLGKVESVEALKAFDAVVEGHAQFVARRVASAWEIPDAFETFERVILYVPETDEELLAMMVNAMVSELTFSYVQGHAFVEAVAADQGEEGVEALLRAPPTSTRLIEHPEEYLNPPAAVARPDLAEALDAFAPLIGDERWTRQKSRILRGTLEAIRPTVPQTHRKTFLEGYEEGHVLVGVIVAEKRQIVVMLLCFDTPEHALANLATERVIQEARDVQGGIPGVATIESAEYDEGAGLQGAVDGFLSRKVVKLATEETLTTCTHTFVFGRILGQILRVNTPEVTRSFENDAIERLEGYLDDPARSRRTHLFDVAPTPLVKAGRHVRMLVVDESGRPVSRAKVAYRTRRGIEHAVVIEGKLLLPLSPGRVPTELFVYGSRSETGRPLNLRPYYRKDAVLGETLAVRLQAGKPLAGRVVDRDGNPVAGIDMRVVYGGPAGEALAFDDRSLLRGLTHQSIRSEDDGTFKILGLQNGRLVPSSLGAEFSRDEQWYRLSVSLPEDSLPMDAIVFRAPSAPLTVRILPDDRIVVRVLDPEGKPFTDGTVVVAEGNEHTFYFLGSLGDGQGSDVKVARPSSPAKAKVLLGNLEARYDYYSPTVEIGPHATSVIIRLARGLEITGRVVDASGRPVVGVTIDCDGEGHDDLLPGLFDDVETDADGRFTFRGLGPGRYSLWITRDEFGDMGEHFAEAGTDVQIVVGATPVPAAPK